VVLASVTFANSGLHETGEGGKHVDWWVDTLVVESTVDEDLSFGDVASKIGNRVGDIYVNALVSDCAKRSKSLMGIAYHR
jgi:hypothetical protein